MKIVKGVLTYTLILIGVLLIAGILLFAGMAFLNFSVFGYRVTISTNQASQEHTVLFNAIKDGDNVVPRTLRVNSNNYKVVIFPFEEDVASHNMKARIRYADQALGLVSNGDTINKTRSILEVLYYSSDNKLITNAESQKTAPIIEINLKTPQGILNYRDSYISIQLPIDSNGNFPYNFDINSGKGDIVIRPVKNSQSKEMEYGLLQVNGLDIETTTGSFSMYGMKESDGYVALKYLNLKTEKGTFNFTEQNVMSEDNVKIESEMGNFKFKNFKGGFTIKGENLVFEANDWAEGKEQNTENNIGTIDTNGKSFLYNCPHGTLRLGKLNVGNQVGEIVTEYAKVSINEVYGDVAIQATYGNTYLGKTFSNVIDVTTTHGDITIDEVLKVDEQTGDTYKGTVACRSTYGDINVKYYADGWFTNKKGQINVEYKGSDSSHKTKIETVDGLAVAKGLRGIVDVTATGGANVKLTFATIPTGTYDSNIAIGSGKLTLNIPQIVSGQSDGFVLNFVDIPNSSKLTVKNGESTDFDLNGSEIADSGVSNYYAAANSYKFNITSKGGNVSVVM